MSGHVRLRVCRLEYECAALDPVNCKLVGTYGGRGTASDGKGRASNLRLGALKISPPAPPSLPRRFWPPPPLRKTELHDRVSKTIARGATDEAILLGFVDGKFALTVTGPSHVPGIEPLCLPAV